MAETTKIPTYAADGRRLRPYSLASIEHLLALSIVVVTRNRRAQIIAAHFRPTDGANPLTATAHMGQRYSYLEHAGDHRVWTHIPLLQRQDIEALTRDEMESPEAIDLYLRRIFRAVPLSCLKTGEPEEPKQQAAPAKAKVISIDQGRKGRERKARPIEFDSERRAA